MKTVFKSERLVLVPENAEEAEQLASWKRAAMGQVLTLDDNVGSGVSLKPLGLQLDVCREPINVTSQHPDEAIRLIANFADTPFMLDGLAYESVESFWQGLKATDPMERRRIAALPGSRAKSDKSIPKYDATFQYGGATIVVGTWDHWQLMKRACTAKFQQNVAAQDALVATGHRPLAHKVRRDSKVIPGVIMADIWMSIRKEFWN
jgi:predicted NAD-dependent protein-ADP-ribosyltransferase YbiA (DUF1768 family)